MRRVWRLISARTRTRRSLLQRPLERQSAPLVRKPAVFDHKKVLYSISARFCGLGAREPAGSAEIDENEASQANRRRTYRGPVERKCVVHLETATGT